MTDEATGCADDAVWAAVPLAALREFASSPGYAAALDAARSLGAVSADIPGLWMLPGYPELTSRQLVQIAADRSTGMGGEG